MNPWTVPFRRVVVLIVGSPLVSHDPFDSSAESFSGLRELCQFLEDYAKNLMPPAGTNQLPGVIDLPLVP